MEISTFHNDHGGFRSCCHGDSEAMQVLGFDLSEKRTQFSRLFQIIKKYESKYTEGLSQIFFVVVVGTKHKRDDL